MIGMLCCFGKISTDGLFCFFLTGNAGRLGTFADELKHQQTRAKEESTGGARRPELVR